MKSRARVVIIGGGAMGVGLAYFLTKEGWSDIVLVEKGELSSGSTWHAAGLIPHFIGSLNMAKVHAIAPELYSTLEEETGMATGWHGCGAIRLATNPGEVDWFHSVKGVLDLVGAECHLVTPAEIKDLYPLLEIEDVLLGAHTPNDGWVDPSSATNSMAAGARRGGAEILRNNRALGTRQLPNGEWEVETELGTIICEHLVNAAGSFSSQVGEWVGLNLPVVNQVHQYLVTTAIPELAELDREPPVLRDPRASCYYRQEHDGLLIGPYEKHDSQVWGLGGISWDFDMELLPPDIERLEPWLAFAAQRIPAFENAGIKQVVSGPITHLPDAGFMMGPAPGLKNYWLCAGASIGITQGPGAGKYLAQWMVHGQTEINVREMDPRRYGVWAAGKYAVERSRDEYHEMYQVRYPGEFREPGRPVKKTPIYDKLADQGAIFAEVFGWERPKWFAPAGVAEEYSFRRTNWFDYVAAECEGVRERVGIADLTAFAKFDVTGPDAESFLQRISANKVPTRPGGIRLVHALTDLGGIESEFTITRLADDRFYLLSAIVGQLHDLDWLVQHMAEGEDVIVTDVTDDFALLALSGPQSRELLAGLTDADLSNDAFPWLQAREVEVAGIPCRALRVSYVGELGWELHHPIDRQAELYDALWTAGEQYGIVNYGSYAMNAMRIEKAYKAWGVELTTEITTVEARLERFVDLERDFIGRDAVLNRTDDGIVTELVYTSVETNGADPLGNEPVLDGDRIIGLTTSGTYGFTVGKSLAFAYVEPEFAAPGSTFDISILGERCTATVLAEPAWDPKSVRPRA